MTKEFSYRVFEQGSDILLAISDLSILGKTFEEGELNITISDFYNGKECSEKDAVVLLKNATMINAVGRNIIALMIKEKIISKDSILKIKGVPHAQVVAIK